MIITRLFTILRKDIITGDIEMTHLYLTTDVFEAENLIEDTEPDEEPQHKYHEIDIRDGEQLAKRIGFNP